MLMPQQAHALRLFDPAMNYSDYPDALVFENGDPVYDKVGWDMRREEVLSIFEEHVYGITPREPFEIAFEQMDFDGNALNGSATKKEVKITVSRNDKDLDINLVIYLPNSAIGWPVPAFVGMNYRGNDSLETRPERWPLQTIIDAGYGVASFHVDDLAPNLDGWLSAEASFCDDGNSFPLIHRLFYKECQTCPGENEWMAIGGWAWGLSRAMDYFESDAGIDHTKVATFGFSRLGKAALWAGAQDERFAIVISAASGAAGAALSRRRKGETIALLNAQWDHWFPDSFDEYNSNEDALPIDQHQLISLMAPRPVYVSSGEDDFMADPEGEFYGALYASPVYEFLGLEGLPAPADEMPAVNNPVMGTIGYHVRADHSGELHDLNEYDWKQYIRFADMHLLGLDVRPATEKLSLHADSGKYFSENQKLFGNHDIDADKWRIGKSTKFTMTTICVAECLVSGHIVGIQSRSGKFWSAQSDGKLNSDRDELRSWEKFILINHSDSNGCLENGDIISLRSSAHGKYVASEWWGGANANIDQVDSSAKMKVVLH